MTPGGGRTQTLDGLRGVAVLAVVVEHAWPDLLPGGFAGVDIFFVLSGFLITGLLVREWTTTGHISLSGFYARRVRRILPAALACIVGIWIGYALLLGPAISDSLQPQALTATFSVSNIYFSMQSTGYFDADPSTSPYLHFWSLAVEEQFYLLWPSVLLVLVFVVRRVTHSSELRRWLPIGILVVVGLVSLAFAMRGNQTSAFYLLPYRGWELIAGGLLAWLHREQLVRLPDRLRPYRVVGVATGAVLIAIVLLFAPSMGRWPGIGTILAVAGTVLLIAGGDSMPGARIVATPVLRFFGRISYALYLWHWPLIAAAGLLVLPTAPATDTAKAVAVLAAIGLATASTFLYEEPIRTSRRPALSGSRAIAVGAASMAAIGIAIATGTPFLSQLVPGSPALASGLPGAATDRERVISDGCRIGSGAGSRLSDCLYGAGSEPDGSPGRGEPSGPVVVLFGDSHASYWFPAVDAWASERGLTLVPLVRARCGPVDAPTVGSSKACLEFRDAALARIEELRPVVTVVGFSSGTPLRIEGRTIEARTDPASWTPAAETILRRLAAVGPVVLIGDAPRPDFPVPSCLAVHRLDPTPCAKDLADVNPPPLVEAEAALAASTGAKFIDPGPIVCPDGVCTWMVDDHVGWVDTNHLSSSAVMTMLPHIRATLDELLASAPAASSP